MAHVRVEGLYVSYAGVGRTVDALAGVDLRLESGEPVSVIGPSGCGKSSLLFAIAGLVPIGGGSVEVAGEAVGGTRLRTALILQDLGLLPWKTVYHNAALGLELRNGPSEATRERVDAALARLGLAEFATAYPGELSGGMRQRVAVARALALDADLLLMDEPLSALDALTREDLQDLLLELWRQRGYASVLVTHSIEEAVYLGRRVVVLTPRPGRVATIVGNPAMGTDGYRETPAFYETCAHLRRVLAEEGALGAVEGGGPR